MAVDFTQESWEIAQAYAAEYGNMPLPFQTAIRALQQNRINNLEKGGTGLDETSMALLLRMLHAKALKACFYYALLTFYGDLIKHSKSLDTAGIIAPFGPGPLASILALIYLNRYSKRLIKEGWDALSRRVQESTEIGGLLGQATPALGFDSSLFIGAMRHIAFGAVLGKRPRLFIDYKKHLKKASIPYDYKWEHEHIGCTLGQIGSILLQQAGFGIDYATSFFNATSSQFDARLDSEPTGFRMVAVWSESILIGCPIPRVEGEDEFAMEEYQMEALLAKAEEIRENGSKFSFLNKTKEDITPDKAPLLYTNEERAEYIHSGAVKDDLDELMET